MPPKKRLLLTTSYDLKNKKKQKKEQHSSETPSQRSRRQYANADRLRRARVDETPVKIAARQCSDAFAHQQARANLIQTINIDKTDIIGKQLAQLEESHTAATNRVSLRLQQKSPSSIGILFLFKLLIIIQRY
jgi:hypothetical protein